jgi:Fur family ferric uptake transcriptional regulator
MSGCRTEPVAGELRTVRMTMPSKLRPPGVDRLTDAVAVLRDEGVRVTGSRQAVLSALFADTSLRTAEEIAGVAYVDLASAYRSLETFEQLGIVQHVHLGHGPGLYARRGLAELEHAVCEGCGAHQSVAACDLQAAREAIHAATGITARFSHFPIVGRCGACAEG